MTPSRSKIWRRWSASVRSKRCCWTTSSYGSSGSTAPQRQRHRAKAALTHPIPCDLCSDGGRKIDVAEIDWSSTLRGEAAEVYARWERELRPGVLGFVPKLLSIWTESRQYPLVPLPVHSSIQRNGARTLSLVGRTSKTGVARTVAHVRMTSDSRCR